MQQLKPANVVWDETSKTLRNLDIDDIYFQVESGMEESQYVFLDGNDLPARFKTARHFRIGEMGFGSGLNFLLTWKLWHQSAPKDACLHYFSIERSPLPLETLRRILSFWPSLSPFSEALLDKFPPFFGGVHTIVFPPGNVTLTLFLGEASAALAGLNSKMDAWYLDGFAPAKNPDIWDDPLLLDLARCTHEGGSFSTFTAAGAVRRGLELAGFTVRKSKGFGKKRDMLTGTFKTAGKTASLPTGVLVLGAGIAGCSLAYALARRGIAVTLLDQNAGPAQQTSGNPAGIIYPKLTAAPSPAGNIHLHSFLFTRRLLGDLAGTGFAPCGTLHLAMDDDEDQRQTKIAALANDAEFVQKLAPDQASTVAGIRLDHSALYVKDAGYLCPPDFCQSLIKAGGPRVQAHFNIAIEKLEHKDGQWQALDRANNVIASQPVAIIASGAGFETFLPQLGLELLRGQVSFIGREPASQNLKTVICHDGYVTPPINGLHYAGATFDKAKTADDITVRDEDHRRNLEKLARNIPALGNPCVISGGRTGYRVAAHDRLPLADAVPEQTGLYALLALGSHGMTTAPLLAEMIAAGICGDPLPLEFTLRRHLSFAKIRAWGGGRGE